MNAPDELLRKSYPSALVAPDGVVRRVNEPMASVLGRSAEQCVGRDCADLLPEDQRVSARHLVAQGAAGRRAMAVLEFPGSSSASVVFLVEAEPVEDSSGGERLVWVHSVDAQNDLASLLIPFRLAAKAAGLGLWMYSPSDRQLQWIGGAPEIASLFPEHSVSLSWVMGRVHPDDRRALHQVVRARSARSPWIEVRFRTEDDRWHHLACQARRADLGYGGTTVTFGVVRDETEQKSDQDELRAKLAAEHERARLITDFSSALITATTEQGLEQVILTRLAATFEGTGAVLGLVDQGTLRVSTDAGISPDQADALHGVSLDDSSPLPDAIRTGKPVLIGGREDYMRRWPHGAISSSLFRHPDTGRTTLLTPLGRADDQPLGAWGVVYGRDDRPSEDEQAFMSTLADLAGQALRRVRTQQARVELATAVQKSMLPTMPEHIPGLQVAARYRPSQGRLDIGGDWYDAFILPDGAVALVIGDVQGHDVEAAASMGRVRAFMRAIADHEPAPGTVLTRTNELLITTDAPRFASCTMLHIDPRAGQVTGASAGHVPILCAHKDGTHDIYTLPGGPVLGVAPDADYPEETFTLDLDSALVLVTDGVVEGPHLTLDAGLERAGKLAAGALQQGLSAEATADRVLEAVDAVDHLDDAAVLVIRRP